MCHPCKNSHPITHLPINCSLCSTKSSNEMLQNLPYFIYMKAQSCFFRFSFRASLYFYLMNALVYVDIDQGIHKVKMKVARNEKQKKVLGLYFYMNIGNFEAFLRNLNLRENCLFWRCAT